MAKKLIKKNRRRGKDSRKLYNFISIRGNENLLVKKSESGSNCGKWMVGFHG